MIHGVVLWFPNSSPGKNVYGCRLEVQCPCLQHRPAIINCVGALYPYIADWLTGLGAFEDFTILWYKWAFSREWLFDKQTDFPENVSFIRLTRQKSKRCMSVYMWMGEHGVSRGWTSSAFDRVGRREGDFDDIFGFEGIGAFGLGFQFLKSERLLFSFVVESRWYTASIRKSGIGNIVIQTVSASYTCVVLKRHSIHRIYPLGKFLSVSV